MRILFICGFAVWLFFSQMIKQSKFINAQRNP